MKKALFALLFLVSASAFARPSGGGLLINVSCPDTSFAPAASITCTFTVQNRDLSAPVDTLALTDTFGGNASASTCDLALAHQNVSYSGFTVPHIPKHIISDMSAINGVNAQHNVYGFVNPTETYYIYDNAGAWTVSSWFEWLIN